MQEVAERAGVSVATVSNALNRPHLVSEQSREVVESAVRALGYVRNGVARQLRLGQSPVVGMVVWTLTNPFFAHLADATETEAEKLGLHVVVGSSDHMAEREARYLELFGLQDVRGVFVVPVGGIPDELHRLRTRGVPVVVLGQNHPPEFSSVSIDGIKGGELAADHLLSEGRRRLAFVGGPLEQVVDRASGVSRTAAAHVGATIAFVDTPEMTIAAGQAAGRKIADMPDSERPDGIIAADDMLAIGILQALVSDGRARVPEDIAIVGYDDIDLATAGVVPLTSVRQPREAIAREAMRIIADADETSAPEHVVLDPELIVRGSTRPIA